MLDKSSPAVSDFLSRLPEETAGGATETRPLAEQVALLEKKDEGFVVPTQVCYVDKKTSPFSARSSFFVCFLQSFRARYVRTSGLLLRDS